MTIDPFVLLAPVLLLAVIALLRFVGCNPIFGIHETTLAPSQPDVNGTIPPFETQNDPGFTLLKVTGVNFVNGKLNEQSVVQWNGLNRDTAFKSDKELWATMTAADIATAGMATVTVFTPDASPPTSNPWTFTIYSSAVPVTFDNPLPPGTGMPNSPLDGTYTSNNNNGALDFGTGNWFWQASPRPCIFVGPPGNNMPTNPTDFNFHNGLRVLQSVTVFVQQDGASFTLSDGVNPDFTPPAPINKADGRKVFQTGWDPSKPSAKVTVTSSVGWNLLIDTITYQGPP